jgi:hypothetical protein
MSFAPSQLLPSQTCISQRTNQNGARQGQIALIASQDKLARKVKSYSRAPNRCKRKATQACAQAAQPFATGKIPYKIPIRNDQYQDEVQNTSASV